MTPSELFGVRLRERRKLMNLTHATLGERCGWSVGKVRSIESGSLKRACLDDIYKAALALEVSPSYFIMPIEGQPLDVDARVIDRESARVWWMAGTPPNHTSLDVLGLGVRAYNCLMREGIDTVEKVEETSYRDMMAIRNFGPKDYDEVIAALRLVK